MKKYVLILLASLAISFSPAPQQENRQKEVFQVRVGAVPNSNFEDEKFLKYYLNLCVGARGLRGFPYTFGDYDRCSNFALKMLEVRETSKGCRKND